MSVILSILNLLLILLFLTNPLPVQAQEQRQKIIIAGAQSITPLAEEFSAQFRKDHPMTELEIRGGGSNYAVKAARRGEIDIGLIARSLTATEKAELHGVPLDRDAIFLLTYPGNPVSSLTLEQIRRIYLGQITNWREVGGEDKGIVPLTRERSSNIHAIFTKHVFGKNFKGQEKAFTIRASKEKILKTIKRIEGSIGYGIVHLEQAKEVKVLEVEGRLPTPENSRKGLYPLTRSRLLICRGRPTGVVQEWMLAFARFARGAAE